MREITPKSIEALKAALRDALDTCCNIDGLRIAAPEVTDDELDHAACLALMSLTRDWVRPEGLKFFVKNGKMAF